MSNSVFPSLPGLTWGTTKTPEWKTIVQESVSGKELAASLMTYPRWTYTLSYEFLRSGAQAELQTLVGFFNARRGKFDDFLYLDPDDNSVTAQQFGVGDGVATSFALVRSYGGFTEPVQNVNGVPVISVNAATMRASTLSLVSTGTDPNFFSPVISVPGSTNFHIKMRVRRVAGSGWDGTAFYSTAAHTFAAGYYNRVSAIPADGLFYTLDWDMSSLTVGGADWTTSTITGIRIDLGASPADIFEIDSVTIGDGTTNLYTYEFDSGVMGWTATGATMNTMVLSSLGVVTFSTPPASGAVLTWTGSYYWRVRFLQDSSEFTNFMQQLYSAKKISFKTVKL